MSVYLGLPNITGSTPGEQINQLQSYIHQLVQQLNWALNTEEGSANAENLPKNSSSGDNSTTESESTFNSIKALIIKSADIVKAYEKTIMTNFNGTYFADSDFGTFVQETNRSIEENSQYSKDLFTNIQTITDKVTGLEEDSRITNAYIKRGLLDEDDNGNPIYGVEVGETTDEGAYMKYARFVSDRLSFFDAKDNEVAYIGNGCLYILGTSRFIGDVIFGRYKMDTSRGIAFTWVG